MSSTIAAMASTVFEGRATLECIETGEDAPDLLLRFDAKTLEFEVSLSDDHELLDALRWEPQLEMRLRNVHLSNKDSSNHLNNDAIENLISQKPLNSEAGVCKLFFSLSGRQELTFDLARPFSEQPAYQIYYGNPCIGLALPDALQLEGLDSSVHFCQDPQAEEVLCASSSSDFFAVKQRIHAGLMLAHGRHLPLVMRLQNRRISFYGSPTHTPLNCLPLLKQWNGKPSTKALLNALLAGFVRMPDEDFNHASFALRFFLLGKTADVPVEVRFLQLMTCVEAMDGAETRQLKEECTAALLGVPGDAAALLNGMRNSLVHGRGGYREAFDAVLAEDFGKRPLQLEAALKPCLSADGELDFSHLWLRLCERLDAFWCAYLGVAPELVKQRSLFCSIPLMPAICLEVLDSSIENLRTEKEATGTKKELQEVVDLRSAIKRLESEKKELAAQLVKQGKCIADLKKSASRH